MLATTDPQRVLPTILSRCQRVDFRRIPLDALEQHLQWIASEESIPIQPEALHVVAQRAQGGLRDAESLLDQLSLLPGPIEAGAVWDLLGAVPEQELLELVKAMSTSEPVTLLEASRQLLDRGRDAGSVLQGMAGILRDLVLMAAAPNRPELTGVSPQFRDQLPDLAKSIGRTRLLQWQAQLRGAEQQLRQSVQPRLWLEVLLLGLLAEPAATTSAATSAPARVSSAAPAASVAAPTPAPAPAPAVASASISSAAVASTANTSTAVPAVRLPDTSNTHSPPSPAAATSEPPAEAAATTPAPSEDLGELWQQILASLELPSTRMLLSQQARLVRIDSHRAVVQVSGNWMGMVQSRATLLEKAIATAMGGNRQLVLENHGGAAPMAAMPNPTASITAPAPSNGVQLPSPPVSAAVVPNNAASPAPTSATASAQPPQATAAPSIATSQTAPVQTGTADVSAQATTLPPVRPEPSAMDEKVKRFADFFNGQVLDVDLNN